MKAAVLHGIGDLRYEDFPEPSCRKGCAIIRVRAVGTCGSDIPRIFETGTYSFPLIPGHEFSGEITEADRYSDTEIKKGGRVTVFPLIPCKKCDFCQRGFFAQCDTYDYLGSRRHGAMAEYVEAPLENIFPIPENVSFEEAALTEPASVALHALYKAGDIKGKTIALFGCGTIGLIFAQVARIKQVKRIFIMDIDEERLNKAKAIGFKYVINSRSVNPLDYIMKETKHGVDIAVEGVGLNSTYNHAISAVSKLGCIVFLGNPLEDIVLKRNNISRILRGEITILGVWNSIALSGDSEWNEVLGYMAEGNLRTTLFAEAFPLSEINEVLNKVKEGKEKRKIIFIP